MENCTNEPLTTTRPWSSKGSSGDCAGHSAANLVSAQASYRAALAGAEVACKALDDTTCTRPWQLVSQRLAQPGERVPVDARIVEIVDLARLELEATVTPAESVAVRIGQTAQITAEGMTQSVKANVVRINLSTSAGSRAVTVYLALDPHPDCDTGCMPRAPCNWDATGPGRA